MQKSALWSGKPDVYMHGRVVHYVWNFLSTTLWVCCCSACLECANVGAKMNGLLWTSLRVAEALFDSTCSDIIPVSVSCLTAPLLISYNSGDFPLQNHWHIPHSAVCIGNLCSWQRRFVSVCCCRSVQGITLAMQLMQQDRRTNLLQEHRHDRHKSIPEDPSPRILPFWEKTIYTGTLTRALVMG